MPPGPKLRSPERKPPLSTTRTTMPHKGLAHSGPVRSDLKRGTSPPVSDLEQQGEKAYDSRQPEGQEESMSEV